MAPETKRTPAAAPPLAPSLPSFRETSDDSSDETAPGNLSQNQSSIQDTSELSEIRLRISQLRNVAESFNNASAPLDKKALRNFHSDAMDLMDSAANVSSNFSSTKATNPSSPGRYTSLRIRRDKQRLEEHYLTTMSFLKRADAGDTSVLVEEVELEGEAASVATDKRQLQNYAVEAMSFLEKAFNLDESVLIEDDEGSDSGRSPMGASPDAESIEHDKAELKRYAEKYGEFLEQALEGDEIVDDHAEESLATRSAGDSFREISAHVDSQKGFTSSDGSAVNDQADAVLPSSSVPLSKRSISRSSGYSSQELTNAHRPFASDRVSFDENLPKSDKYGDQATDSKGYPKVASTPTVNLVLTGLTGSSQEINGVPLHGSYFRRLPRGATVRIETSQPGRNLISSTGSGVRLAHGVSHGVNDIALERNALIGLLEEILNERSMLAVQVSEMKQMVMHARGDKSSFAVDAGNIDLSEDLCSAYETMRTMTEETEETINFLEEKHLKACAEKDALEIEVRKLKAVLEAEDLLVVEQDLDPSELAETNANMNYSGKHVRTSLETELFLMQQSTVQREIEWSQLHHDRERSEIMKLTDQIEEERELNRKLQSTAESRDKELRTALDQAKTIESRNSVTITDLKQEAAAANAMLSKATRDNVELNNEIDRLKLVNVDIQEKYNSLLTDTDSLKLEVEKLNTARDNLQSNLLSARVEQKTAAEYKTSLSEKEVEFVRLQRRYTELEREARAREEQMHRQMQDFKVQVDRAVAAAQTAEQNASQAAATASTARSNAQAQIESERASRSTVERELREKDKELKAMESQLRTLRNYAQSSADNSIETSDSNLSKSSSRRAISNLVASGSRRGVARKDPEISASGVANSRPNAREWTISPGSRPRWEGGGTAPQSEDAKNRRKPYRRFFS